jgi:hypothetical protein
VEVAQDRTTVVLDGLDKASWTFGVRVVNEAGQGAEGRSRSVTVR